MPRFTHAVTGVTVSVDDDTAANLGSEWTTGDSGDEKTSRRKSTK